MSRMKARLQRQEDQRDRARALLRDRGVIELCEDGSSYEVNDADALPQALKAARRHPPQGCTPEEYAAIVQSVYDDTPYDCP
jgi:hypothetical protein